MQFTRSHIEFTLKPAITAPALYWLVIGRGECEVLGSEGWDE